MKLEIYCDGSATIATKPGGWAFVVVLDGNEIHRQNGGLQKATNNMAEISAAINGLEWFIAAKNNGSPDLADVKEVELVSDSQLVLRYANGEYGCKAQHLVPLYIKLRNLYNASTATTRWVKGHNGDHYNEICDELAKAARAEQEK